MQDLIGKVAVVTGAASGIGRALAEAFAAEHMTVVVADVEEPALLAVERDLRARGATALAVRTDVSQPADVDALAERAFDAFGVVHVLCNNAGVFLGGPLWERTVADWQWVLGVNLWGVIHGIRAFVPRMLAQDTEGHVVNTASMAGLMSMPFAGVYHVSKHGVVTLSEVLHHELIMTGAKLRVSVLCPGLVNTRIGASDRNRPPALRGEAAEARKLEREMTEQALRQGVAAGIAPAHVAARVLAAIRSEQFYVIPGAAWKEVIRARMDDVLLERSPTFVMPPTDGTADER